VNFVNPKNRSRITIEGKIVRSFPATSDTTSCYGIQFNHMSEKTKKELFSFIYGKS
jgi:c-di-GMP-binding flagellar brake protein YcgR